LSAAEDEPEADSEGEEAGSSTGAASHAAKEPQPQAGISGQQEQRTQQQQQQQLHATLRALSEQAPSFAGSGDTPASEGISQLWFSADSGFLAVWHWHACLLLPLASLA
jgi:hypothetical protein